MKRFLYLLILSISLALFGCNDSGSVKENDSAIIEEVDQIEVQFSITIPDEVEKAESIEPTNIMVDNGDTIVDVTEKSGNDIDVDGSGENAFVEGINDLYSFDEGTASGWLIKVNGEFIDVGPGAYEVEEGDEIEWLYTVDFNREFE